MAAELQTAAAAQPPAGAKKARDKPEEKLYLAAAAGETSEVESLLAFMARKGAAVSDMAERALKTAVQSRKWDTVGYLADFLSDVERGEVVGGAEENAEGPEDAKAAASSADDTKCETHVGVHSEGVHPALMDAERSILDCIVNTSRGPGQSSGGDEEQGSAPMCILDAVKTLPAGTSSLHDETSALEVVAEFAMADDEDGADGADGVPFEDYSSYLPKLRDKDEVVIDKPTARFAIDYPLKAEVVFEVSAPTASGFTRADVLAAAADQYQKIYETEEKTSTVPPGKIPGTDNRNTTNGTYGIWGHFLGDLQLHSLVYDPGARVYRLGLYT